MRLSFCNFVKYCIVILSACCSSWAPAAQRVALVIGNASYQFEDKLRNPINDARLLAQTFRTLNFDRVDELTDATQAELLTALDQFRDRARGAQIAVIYFSGHGMKSQAERQNYLLPIDMPNTSANVSNNVDIVLRTRAVSEAEFINTIGGAAVQLLIIDACRDNKFSSNRSGNKGLTRSPVERRGRLIAYATQENSVAKDGSGRNSPYAESLAAQFARRDRSIIQALDEVADEVAKKTFDAQVPTKSGDLRYDIYFVTPSSSIAGNSAIARSDPEEEAYRAAVAADGIDGYEQYLRDYPSARNASAVRIKLAAARKREASGRAATVPSDAQSARPLTLLEALPPTHRVAANPATSSQAWPGQSFADDFQGSALDSAKWNVEHCGTGVGKHTLSDGVLILGPCDSVTSRNKFTLSGSTIVVEAKLRGPKQSGRDSSVSLVDAASKHRIQVGDTNYRGNGLYYYVTDQNGNTVTQQVAFGGSTSEWRELRLTFSGASLIIERAERLGGTGEKRIVSLPISTSGKTYFVQLATGGADGYYSPAQFDWIRARSTP